MTRNGNHAAIAPSNGEKMEADDDEGLDIQFSKSAISQIYEWAQEKKLNVEFPVTPLIEAGGGKK